MKINELRSMTNEAFARVGLEERTLFAKGTKAWCLPEGELTRFFQPQPYRRGWGFVFTGNLGIEIPRLRQWLRHHHPGDPGIFHHSFVAYQTLNDGDRGDFMVTFDEPVPADRWATDLRDKLAALPATLDDLISTYRDNPESLGVLARPLFSPAWHFLMRWAEMPDTTLRVPKMGPDGRIAE